MKKQTTLRKKARPLAARITQTSANGKRPQKKNKTRRSVSKNRKKVQKAKRKAARAAIARQRQRTRGLDEKALHKISKAAFGKILHHKQVLSFALVALGVLYTAKMTIHAIGAAMAGVRGAIPKHGIKQVDRYMSNEKIKPADVRHGLVWFVVGERKRIDTTMDWTDFDKDDQTVLVISLVLKHGRAVPLVWLSVRKSTLEGRRSMYEKMAAIELKKALPDDVKVTLMADRGFGDTKLFDHLLDIPGFDFIVRFKKCYAIASQGYSGKAEDAIPKNGRIRVIKDAKLTGNKRGPYNIVLYKAAKMKDSWCLATSIDTDDGRDIVTAYGRRFECEEGFRDLKDWRFGLALKYTRIGDDARRERLLFAFALAAFLLTLVGTVSENFGLDRLLRANTSKVRTHSLFRQGREIVAGALPDALERQCMMEVKQRLAAALNKGLCHAFS
jgi:hypothetical protein